MPVITISRQTGSLGDEVGRSVAARLGLRLVDQDIISEVAGRLGVSTELVTHRDEREAGLVTDLVRTMRRLYPATMTPSGQLEAELDEATYLQVMRQVTWEIARAGDAVILGRGASFLLERNPGILHVLVISPTAVRAERVMGTEGCTPSQAARKIKDADSVRARYIRRFYGQNWLDVAQYDLVVNTGHFSEAAAVDLVVHAVRADAPPATAPDTEAHKSSK